MKSNLLAILLMSTISFNAVADTTAETNTLSLRTASAKVVIRKISGKDGKITEVCHKSISVPVFKISNHMPTSPLPFVPVTCEALMGQQGVTVTVTPSVLEGIVPANIKDLMLADLGGGYVKYFGGILTVEPFFPGPMRPAEQKTFKNALKYLQAPVMNGSGIVGSAPAKAFVTLAPAPMACTGPETENCKAVDQFTATLLIQDQE